MTVSVISEIDGIWISDNDIVPDDYQNQLIHWRDLFVDGYFAIGDIANRLVRRSAEMGFPVTDKRVYKAVGRFCGKSPRTVRYYAETSAFYPEEVRDEFDMLPFSHFVFARSTGEQWREVLEFGADDPDCTLERLRYEFVYDKTEECCEPSRNNGSQPDEIMLRSFAGVRPETHAGEECCELSRISKGAGDFSLITFVGDTVSRLEDLRGMITSSKLDDDDKRRGADAISVIESIASKMVKVL